jgi:hypothetical protein
VFHSLGVEEPGRDTSRKDRKNCKGLVFKTFEGSLNKGYCFLCTAIKPLNVTAVKYIFASIFLPESGSFAPIPLPPPHASAKN